jgi:hypothetical protein
MTFDCCLDRQNVFIIPNNEVACFSKFVQERIQKEKSEKDKFKLLLEAKEGLWSEAQAEWRGEKQLLVMDALRARGLL